MLTSRGPAAPKAPAYPGELRPEAQAVKLWTFSSKGIGMKTPDSDGLGTGTDFSPLRINGEGIYVVDCPLGYSGRLLVNGKPYEISPGMVIPDRYGELAFSNMPAAGSAPCSDAPIVLAVGPRALEYRAPGWRVHRWRRGTVGMTPSLVAEGDVSSYTRKLWIEGYDWWTAIYQPNGTVEPTVWDVRVEFSYRTMAAALEETSLPDLKYLTRFSMQGLFSGLYVPIAGGGPLFGSVSGTQAGRGLYTANYDNDLSGIDPAILHGFPCQTVRFRVENWTVGGTISGNTAIFYAGLRVF